MKNLQPIILLIPLTAAACAEAGEFDRGLRDTVEWYRRHEQWWRPIKHADPAFRSYYEAQYGKR